MPLDISTPAR